MVFRVDYWDAFDGWGQSGFPVGTGSNEFELEADAVEKCKELQAKNPPNSMGEHYGVIDLDKSFEIFCGKHWFERQTRESRPREGVV
jgi:hypothetical protein